MRTEQFKRLTARFEIIKNQVNRCTDSVERSDLLIRMNMVLEELGLMKQWTKLEAK
jgi:hypothetical protein